MIRERFDRLATRGLSATDQYHRDAVWYRLSAGGIGLPSSIIAVASYVVSQGGSTLHKTLDAIKANESAIYGEISSLNTELARHGASVEQCLEAGSPASVACQAFQNLKRLAETGSAIMASARDFQVFRLCWGLGFGQGPHSTSCGAGSTLLIGSGLLVTLWLVAVWLPYLDGPRHATMPRLWFMVACSAAVTLFVGFVNALLLT